MTPEQAKDYLYPRQGFLSLNMIAKVIKVDVSNFHKAVNGLKNNKGTVVKIPERAMPKLTEVIEYLKGGGDFLKEK